MKKHRFTAVEGIIIAIMLFFVTGLAIAASGNVISTTVLNNVTNNTSGVIGFGREGHATFFATTASPANSTVEVNLSVKGSYDKSDWTNISFCDFTNGTFYTIPLTAKTLSANSTYIFWLDPGVAIPYVNISIASNASGTNTSNITVSGVR